LAVVLDATDEGALQAQGIDKAAAAVVAIGTAFEAAALATSVLKQIGVHRVISRASTRARGEILLRIGADEIVNPEEETADRWRDRLVMPQVRDKIDLGESHALIQMRAPSSWAGKTLHELNIRKKYEVNVVAIRRLLAAGEGESGSYVIDTPLPDSRIETGDTLLVVGRNESLELLPND
jgi:trk system potassium uptake protein TrkA